jgi:hypothetical protein
MTQKTPKVDFRIASYEVCCVPFNNINRRHWVIKVEHRGFERWSVTHEGSFLGRDGWWSDGCADGESYDQWLDDHRFGEQEAIALATHWAPKVKSMGKNAAELAMWERDLDESGS